MNNLSSIGNDKRKDKAVIFDMDGVLVDSFENYYYAYKKAFDGIKGTQNFTKKYYRQYFGAKSDYTLKSIEKDFNIKLDYEKIKSEKTKNYMENARKSIIPFTENIKALKELSKIYKIAVASSSIEEVVEHSLKSVNIDDFVEVKIPGDSVERGKPEPDIFLLACEKLGIQSYNAVVIEDSVPGMNASYSAGIKCICLLADNIDENRYDKAYVKYRISQLKAETLINKVKEILK